jgi:hypothetical protein
MEGGIPHAVRCQGEMDAPSEDLRGRGREYDIRTSRGQTPQPMNERSHSLRDIHSRSKWLSKMQASIPASNHGTSSKGRRVASKLPQ